MFKLLLSLGANVRGVTTIDDSIHSILTPWPLEQVFSPEDSALQLCKLKLLVSVDPNQVESEGILGRHPFEEACFAGSLEMARFLQGKGAHVFERDKFGRQPLHWTDSELFITYLLSLGADPNSRDLEGNTPLILAASDASNGAMRMLVRAGAKPNASNDRGDTPLMTAVARGNESALGELLTDGADINFVSKQNGTVLVAAVNSGNFLNVVLSKGADPNLKDHGGETALHLLWRIPRMGAPPLKDLIDPLLRAGADIESEDNMGFTPLMQSIRYSNMESVVALIQCGASLDRTSRKTGLTTLEIAITNPPYLEKLLEEKADPNERDRLGNTPAIFLMKWFSRFPQFGNFREYGPLLWETARGDLQMLKKHGADLSAVDPAGRSVLSIGRNHLSRDRLNKLEALVGK
jgi:cytohesin